MPDLLSNTNEPNALILTLVVLAFFVALYLFVKIGNKKEIKKREIIKNIQDNNPDVKIEYRYFIDINESNFIFNFKDIRNSGISIACYVFFFFIFNNILSSILLKIYCANHNVTLEYLQSNEEALNLMNNTLTPYLELGIYLPVTIAVFIIMFNNIKSDFKNLKKGFIKDAFWGLLFIYSGSIIGSLILSTLRLTDESSNEQAIIDMINNNDTLIPLIIISFVSVILAPIIEELIFRKSIFNLCKNNTRLAIVLSSLFFGLIHVINPTINVLLSGATYLDIIKEIAYIVVYSLMGVGLALAYVKSNRNIIVSILAHMFNNLISMAITILISKLSF